MKKASPRPPTSKPSSLFTEIENYLDRHPAGDDPLRTHLKPLGPLAKPSSSRYSAIGLLLAACLAAWLLLPQERYQERGQVSVEVYRLRGTRLTPWHSGVPLLSHDLLQIEILSSDDGMAYAAFYGRDENLRSFVPFTHFSPDISDRLRVTVPLPESWEQAEIRLYYCDGDPTQSLLVEINELCSLKWSQKLKE